MRKQLGAVLLSAMLLLVSGCAQPTAPAAEGEGLRVVATLFPQYDFARELMGDDADITLLLPPGVESHSFEPTPADVIKIAEADLFVYTGEYMEPWAKRLLEGLDSPVRVLDLSQGIPLDEEHADESAEEHAAHTEHGHGQYDPHIWTDPQNAMKMVENLREELCTLDPANAERYRANATHYLGALVEVDKQLAEVVAQGKRKEILFGGRFALTYFARRYDLTYTAAFDSCAEQSEPSVRTLTGLIDKIETDRIPVIYYEELVEPRVARAIAEQTGAKMLLLHSCHNLSREEFARGETYLSLMRQNVEHLKEGLN